MATGAIEDITTLFEYLAENASLWDARNVTERLITATDRLADYPGLYETDERYDEGVRRISLLGQHVLYEVNDKARRVNIPAVVGQRQNPRFILLSARLDAGLPRITVWEPHGEMKFSHAKSIELN